MAKSDLQKLSRAELLEMLIEQTERADQLEKDLQEARKQLKARELMLKQAGELAKAMAGLLKKIEREPLKVTIRNANVSVSDSVKRTALRQEPSSQLVIKQKTANK